MLIGAAIVVGILFLLETRPSDVVVAIVVVLGAIVGQAVLNALTH